MRLLLTKVPQLQRLAVFEAVSRLGSFTAAASELGISQPAVSRHIGQLEDQLGFPLFDRRSNRIELTSHASRLQGVVSASFDELERTLVDLQRTKSSLQIAAPPVFSQSWLSPGLEDLRARLDPCSLSLLVIDGAEDLDNVIFDVAIRGGFGDWSGFRSEKLLSAVVVPLASPELADELSLSASADPATLISAPLLHLKTTGQGWIDWNGWFAGQGIRHVPKPSDLAHEHFGVLLNEALAGKGVLLGWRYMTGDWLERGLLVEVGPEVHDPSAGYYLIWPTAINRDRRVRVLRSWFDDTLPPGRFTAHG